MDFKTCTPQMVGIKDEWLIRFLSRLESQQIHIHSAIIMKDDYICMETYYAPYDEHSLHRMFSITKSFVAMAIGLLADEGRISLDDHIVDYFPDKLPAEGPHPYLAMLTIRQMLMMKTCHDKTTYKGPGVKDWVGSFFTTTPTHVPGTSFAYDTSSTHVLGALVERLSNMSLLDYLRSKGLDELGFSKNAYAILDPSGVSCGGSGMCATSRDLLIMMTLIANGGRYMDKQYLPEWFVNEAITKHSDPSANHGSMEEMIGYGYQIWLTRHNGIVLFGMGGQLALYLPEQNIYMITTADAQGRQGGVQLIYEAFYQEVYDKLTGKDTYQAPDISLAEYLSNRKLITIPGELTSPVAADINHKNYICDTNSSNISAISVALDESAQCGVLTYTKDGRECSVEFGLGYNKTGIFPDYSYEYAANAIWKMPDYLLIRVNVTDERLGNMYIGLNFRDEYITVVLKKFVEFALDDYTGVFSGIAQ